MINTCTTVKANEQLKINTFKNNSRVSRCFEMEDPFGFHLRPAALFTATARHFSSSVAVLTNDGQSADGKSILGLMSLGILSGDTLMIAADGDDAPETMRAIENLFTNSFEQPTPDTLPHSALRSTLAAKGTLQVNNRAYA